MDASQASGNFTRLSCPSCGRSLVLRTAKGRPSWKSANRKRRRLTAFAAKSGADSTIANLPEICDDFQCNSSPQVESTIRSFARNIEEPHSNRMMAILAQDVTYKEKGRVSFKGSEGYKANNWNVQNIGEYRTKVTSLEMQSTDTARVCWQWSGTLGPMPASASVVSTVKLNTLTGRITEHTDEVQLTGNPAASALYTLRKGLWGARQRAKQAGGRVNDVLDNWSGDDDDGTYYTPDPTDPNKFIEQKDTRFQDGVQWALFLAILWTVWTAYANLDGF